MDESKLSGMAISSMVLGICGIVFCWIPLLAVAANIVGIVLARKGSFSQTKKGFATAGLVTSIIGLVFSSLYTLFYFLVFIAASTFSSIY